MDSTKGGVMVHNGSKSSFVMDVKSKQDLDPILVELKESVLKKFFEAFSDGGYGVLRYQGRLCVLNVDGLMEQILEEAHSSGILFTREPPRCIVICGKSFGGMA